jgi:outer membrane protein OmpA-like peptidoglycan-associated protein
MEALLRRAIRFSILGAVLCGLLGGDSTARAQTASGGPNSGFEVNRFEPTAAGEYTFGVDHPWYSAMRRVAAGMTLDYADHPLVLGLNTGNSYNQQSALIGGLFIAHMDVAVSFLDRILLTASLPVTLYDNGSSMGGATVGDPRLGIMGRLWGQPYHSIFSVSLGVAVWIPLRGFISSIPSTDSDQQVRFLPKLVFGGVWRFLLWSVTAGFLYRPDAVAAMLPVNVTSDAAGHVGSELQFGFGLSYYDAVRRFAVGPEVLLATTVTGPTQFSSYGTSLEALIAGHDNIAQLIQVGLAGGLGFIREPGTPDFRVLARIAYAPLHKPAKDSDGDGIPDSEDACIHEKGIRTGNPMTHGCPPPLPDRDRDGVIDRDDLCPDTPAGSTPDPARPGCPKTAELIVDRDGDGVPDKEDACPDVPKGPQPDPSRLGCPAQDSDKDGVIDPLDQCLFDPAGLFPDPARPGCPLPDRDGDGIPDPMDACPDKAGAPSPFPKRNGCPGLVEVKNGQIVILRPVYFATDKDTILPKSYPVLQAVADAMEAVPSIKHVAIEGHTDAQGNFTHNLDLSDRRAKSVMKWLFAKSIAPERLEAKGYGPARPIASNKTAAGRAKNRRVEFHIVDAPAPAPAETPGQTPAQAPTQAPAPVIMESPMQN